MSICSPDDDSGKALGEGSELEHYGARQSRFAREALRSYECSARTCASPCLRGGTAGSLQACQPTIGRVVVPHTRDALALGDP
jgi:hypothetical protein